MYEQLGMLKVNKLSKKDATLLADSLKQLVELCTTELNSHLKNAEDSGEYEDDLIPGNFEFEILRVNESIKAIKQNVMDDKTAAKAYKDIKSLLKICDNLNGYDFFGTEGWQHQLGLD